MAKPPKPPAAPARPPGARRAAERALLALVVASAIGVGVVGFLAWQQSSRTARPGIETTAVVLPPAAYVGHAACVACHAPQAEAWRGSQHAQAMQPATPATVLGHFDGTRVTYSGVT
ncbi:MAG TPA: multiheme c-type cytochrome, partial [Burkholderiales bacterium]